jgi:2-dehydro-3-deoxy-D-arabinonate dehydratase
MEIIRYLDAGRGPLAGVHDGAGVHELPVPGLAALLALPLAEIRDLTAAAAAGPAVAGEVTLLAPAEGRMEVWAAGVTYFRSRQARLEESGGADFYDRVYDAERPELFFKSVPWRVVTHGQPIAIRRDSALNVPEAELAIVVNSAAEIIGYTICDDVSSRAIEAENPLYLPQAKVYAGACALAPIIRPAWEISPADLAISLEITRDGAAAWSGRTSTSQIKRPLQSLVDCLFAEQNFPDGAIVSTGTGIVPEITFTLAPGDTVTIEIDQLGILTNTVVAGKDALGKTAG